LETSINEHKNLVTKALVSHLLGTNHSINWKEWNIWIVFGKHCRYVLSLYNGSAIPVY